MLLRTHAETGIELGNKARHLFQLRSLGIQVPALCVLAFEDLQSLLREQHLQYKEEHIRKVDIPERIIDDIKITLPGCRSFAVRSSTAAEDGKDQSFAGQFATYLNVPVSGLAEAIRAVWLSSFNARVKAYNKEADSVIPMAVIIQECVEADVSGVVFTADPVTGDAGACVVNSVYGLGEGLVSGLLDADMFLIRDGNIIKEEIAEKMEKLAYKEGGELQKVKVEDKLVNQPSMNLRQLLALKDIAITLEKYFAYPQDIEFCIRDEKLYILQSRPITTLGKKMQADYLVWDNSNIIESYPGITLPLTFSFISPVYSAVYRQLSSVLGINAKTIEQNGFVYDNMLGLLRGRVYYNLYSWYKILSLLPGYGLNAGFMEKMMGVSEKFELKDYKKPNSWVEKMQVLKLVFSLLGNARRLPRMREEFVRNFNRVMSGHRALHIENADAHTCMHAYLQFESTLSKEWKAPLVNDFFAMIYYGLFQKFMEKHQRVSGQDQNHFLIGTGKVITVEPAYLQQRISALIRSELSLKELFANRNEEDILQWMYTNSSHPLSLAFDEYIQKWGDRCFAELKLETITYRQDPAAFVRILKHTFENHTPEQAAHEAPVDNIKLSWLKKRIFNFLRKKAVDTVTARENLRFERTRAFAEVRQIFLRLGGIFYEHGILEAQRDIFYLGKSEIFDLVKGTSIHLSVKELVELRKKEYGAYFSEPTQEPRIKTDDIVYLTRFATEIASGEKTFKGIPCCPGVVTAEVRVVHSPDDIQGLEGKILVTTSTDPGWVSVFPLVKGILVQRGSVLSHAAIVSRELRIPCIVGIKNICNVLQTGDVVTMDAGKGTISILKNGN